MKLLGKIGLGIRGLFINRTLSLLDLIILTIFFNTTSENTLGFMVILVSFLVLISVSYNLTRIYGKE